ncbi:hypothetical protein [Methylobacterium isbiliense]|jgi:hypothetical protein|uniref:Uncharacterized protein n=1 Tax=Methylobacterium isbiliense TaxID=315478 RepID=A0ABQ4SN56_9HYPH|nr:hypothetical protein [Methylobacterium isbiliense]MDN3622295.1 hypothetical protein [Methylobacterium isbiliense]GJE03323.1 hypothetical protein GMJLKIPL_5277 [Methylobacterium isbiliense]
MARPHDPHADALRAARRIVEDAGMRLVQAAHHNDPTAIADACHNLVVSIAQAIVDAEQAAAEQGQRREEAHAVAAGEVTAHWRSWPATLFGVPGRVALAVETKEATREAGPPR